jgi:hypothetical protein
MGTMCTTRSYVMLPSEKSSLRAVVITCIKNYFPVPAVPSTLSCFNLQNNILLFTLQHAIDNFRQFLDTIIGWLLFCQLATLQLCWQKFDLEALQTNNTTLKYQNQWSWWKSDSK